MNFSSFCHPLCESPLTKWLWSFSACSVSLLALQWTIAMSLRGEGVKIIRIQTLRLFQDFACITELSQCADLTKVHWPCITYRKRRHSRSIRPRADFNTQSINTASCSLSTIYKYYGHYLQVGPTVKKNAVFNWVAREPLFCIVKQFAPLSASC